MYKMDKKPLGILICIIVGSIILVASLFFSKVDQQLITGGKLVNFGQNWKIAVNDRITTDVDVPTYIKNVKFGDTLVLKKYLPKKVEDNTYVLFRASHQNVKVYIGDTCVYHFGWDQKRLFGKSPACTWVLVPLTEGQSGLLIRIELTGVYKRYANMINDVYIGEKSAVIQHVVRNHLGSILICFGLFVIGIGMIVVAIALRDQRTTTSLMRLGILSALVGCWSVFITNMLQVFCGNVFFLLNLEYLLFDLLLPVLLWFLLSFQYYRERKWMNGFFWASILQFMLVEALQLTGIADYMESIVMTHALMIGTICWIILTGIRDLFHKHASRATKVLVFSVLVSLVFSCIDIVRFYQLSIVDEGFFTRIGMMVFIVLWAIEVIRNMSKSLVNLAKTEALEVLAYVDLMTGLKNRTAFEEWMNSYQTSTDKQAFYIVAFDMNGLKDINDNFGHLKGDQAIIALAETIKETFEPQGTCYRIGGDELCVIYAKTDINEHDSITKLLQEIEAAVAAKSKEMNLVFSAAVGYSEVLKDEQKDIFQAYREADSRMYKHKQKMKRKDHKKGYLVAHVVRTDV